MSRRARRPDFKKLCFERIGYHSSSRVHKRVNIAIVDVSELLEDLLASMEFI